uniref:C3H1-type domain-containing protein n=1 Tax=Cynoglossus semilaevis TaxID=244447 RepID=A0A3P8WV07_CYNSE
MGKCHFGKRCRLAHRSLVCPLIPSSPAGMNKKPRMRTADDVISRILWDPTVEASEFMVGYLDRFLGVVERPFCDFSWDTAPCDCDYSVELALPRHRIQYFSYRRHRVWDRNTRTDRVFGSTGQSLAPPFGEEEEVKVSGHLSSGHLSSGHLSSGQLSSGQLSSLPQGHRQTQHSPAGSLPFTLFYLSGVTKGAGERWCSGVTTLSSCLSQRPQTVLDMGRGTQIHAGRPPKKKPTHFISFRANTPAVLSSFQQLQEEITALLPSSAPYWSPASSLHVTLCLLVLRGPAEVATAVEILRQFAYWDRNPPVAVTFPVKLKHFNGKVLFLSPQPQLHLRQLNSGLQEAYRKEGLLHRASFDPRYHLTLAKVKEQDGERLFEGVGDLKVGKGLTFGRLPVNTLHLCVVGSPRVDGFYQSVCAVTLR